MSSHNVSFKLAELLKQYGSCIFKGKEKGKYTIRAEINLPQRIGFYTVGIVYIDYCEQTTLSEILFLVVLNVIQTDLLLPAGQFIVKK
jgi:hypothetical protein